MMSDPNAPQRQSVEARQASLDLLYKVSRELTSTLDLATVLQRVLSLSIDTVGANSGIIIILNDAGNPVESAIIYKDQVIPHTIQQLQTILEQGLAGWVLRNRMPALVLDTSTDERWLRRPEDKQSATGAKSVIAVPIIAREKLVGVATLSHPKPNALKQDDLNLFQTIANQASVAVLNARLYNESQRRARVMTALAESAGAITSSIHLDLVLNNILKQIQEALRADTVALALADLDRQELAYKAVVRESGPVSPKTLNKRFPIGKGVSGWVVGSGQGAVITDLSTDLRYDPEFSIYPEFTPTAIACAPIKLHGSVIGAIEAIILREDSFDPDALTVLSGISNLAGSSIHNAQLFEEVQVAHNRYHDLFDNDINPIIITDWDGNISEINRETVRASRFSPRALLAMNIRQLHKINWEELGENFIALKEGGTGSYESTLAMENEETCPILVNVHAVKIAGEDHLQWIFQDITERKKLDQLRDDLTSMIYHDLRSPLSNVISSIDVLKAMLPVDESPEYKSLLDIAARSTERIQRLTQSLLDIARLEAGRPITEQQAVSPVDIARKAYQALIPIAINKDQDVSITVSEKLPQVYVDGDMIERVLINLLQNAIKYTPPHGEIEIGAQEEGERVHIWVKDNGRGVETKEKDAIFNKFTRLHAENGPKGLGLGLAFCRLAVEGHGGRIWVDDNPTGGAIFSFTLPTVKSK